MIIIYGVGGYTKAVLPSFVGIGKYIDLFIDKYSKEVSYLGKEIVRPEVLKNFMEISRW